MQPHKRNFCGGNFQDWLEVNLTDKCNGRCSWCIEKDGYHPKKHVNWRVMVRQALNSGKTNIILLGGEPTLYGDISRVIRALRMAFRKVWITTNGGIMSPAYVMDTLVGVTGVNVSVHDSDLIRNKTVTGVSISDLEGTIVALHKIGATVRLNCNCILGHIDSAKAIGQYVAFAKSVGADKVRFAELKQDKERFVDLAEVMDYQYGLNDNPFVDGCNNDAVIDGIPVSFRQMCGFQTPKRPTPKLSKGFAGYEKQVLYYDGRFYNGWQTEVAGMKGKKLGSLLEDVANGKVSSQEAQKVICKREKKRAKRVAAVDSGGYCRY